ncbi:hypothetical protein DW805_14325 [Ruminococcus sp. AM32-17LB]|nr:hypothetical protein DW805_14325 [Ruminococcus sp. AM32-17LB]
MKKKVLAFLLASTMVIEPFTVASAADFSDGMGQDTVQFSDDAEDVPEVENDDVDQFDTDAVGEGENSSKPPEDTIQMGDDVWFTFDDSTGTATISGTGDMWDYYENGYDYTNKHQNPFAGKSNVQKIVISEGVTNVGDYFLQGYEYRSNIKEISLSSTITKIGRYAFQNCYNVKSVNLPGGLETIGDYSFDNCSGLIEINVPDSVKSIGKNCFQSCRKLSTAILPDTLIEISEFAFFGCSGLTEITLPSKLESIGRYAFSGCSSLTGIILPASIKNIKWSIFSNCTNLTEVTFEKGYAENISENMFENCTALTDISIPEEVSGIYSNAFCDCSRLSTVTINGSKTRINSDSFRNCKNLRLIKGCNCSYTKKYYDSLTDTQKDSIKFDSLGEGQHEWSAEKVQTKEPTCTEKGIKANKCNICGVIDESSKEEIPAYDHKWDNGVIIKQATETEQGEIKYTCWRCKETKIKIIPKLSDIQINYVNCGWNTHNGVSIDIEVNKKISYYAEIVEQGSTDVPIYDSNHEMQTSGNAHINFKLPLPEKKVDIYVFLVDDMGNNTYVKLLPDYSTRPDKPVIRAGYNITASLDGETLTLSGTGETYDNLWWADSDDNEIIKSNVKYIVVEDGITALGYELFKNFNNVETIELPASLTKIKNWTFQNCRSLKSISIPEGVTEIGNGIFNDCVSLKNITFPSTLKEIPDITDCEDSEPVPVESITLKKGIQTIGFLAFSGLSKLKNINIPDSVTTIEQSAFADCTSLTELSLPDSITKIEYNAFGNCEALDKIVLPSNLTLLGNAVFRNCNVEITFPASLKYIPYLGDNAVRKVTISEGVETIGVDAFFNSHKLTEITLPSTITSIESGAFSGTGIASFNYPQNFASIESGVFQNTSLKEFSVPKAVTEINDQAFTGCTDLVKISIPESVKYIGTDVFKNCRNLTIYGYKDTAAESYAKANNIKFISADYKVIFKDNGRTQKTEYVLEGENATPPSLKEKPGYTLSWDADYTNIQEDMVINAVWTKKDNGGGNTTIIVSPSETNKYTVTFKDRGEVIKTEKVKSGDAAEYPFITRSGYKLSWDKDFSKVTANITVNAVWTVIKPEKVTSLTAESGKKSIALSWDETEYAGYYLVYRKADSEKEYTQVAKTTKILWTDSKAVPGTQYSYKVVAVRSLSGKKYQGAESDVVTTKIGTPQIGDTYSVGDLNYKLTGTKEVTVTGLAKVTDTLVIPSSVTISGKVYKVTAIQDKAFYRNEDIVNVTIGNNVVNVGKYAFYQCSGLETVKFGKRVAIINTCAFTQCPNLENVTLPSSIRKIGAKAFYQCTSIKIFKINGSALEYVGKKGLAINKTVTLRLPKKSYSSYRKLIKASSVYVRTKFVKF